MLIWSQVQRGSSIGCTIKCLTDNLDRCTQPQIDIPRVVLRKVLTRQWSVYGHWAGFRVCILVCGWIILGKHWDWDTGWTMNVNTGQQGSNTFIFIPHHIVLHCFSLIGMNLIVWTNYIMSLLLSLMVSKQISFSVPAGSLQTTQNQNNTFLPAVCTMMKFTLTTDSSEAQYVRGSQAGHELPSQVSASL